MKKETTMKLVNTIHAATEVAYGNKLGYYHHLTEEEQLKREAHRLGAKLLSLDIIMNDADADTFDGVVNVLATELGAHNVDRILKLLYAYQEA